MSSFAIFTSYSTLQSRPHCTVREILFPELLKETDDTAARRLACKEMRDLLLQAMEIVNEVSCLLALPSDCLH